MESMARAFGRILEVDLGSGKIRDRQTDQKDNLAFVGGAGLAARIYAQSAPPGLEPLDPRSPFITLTGPLTGTQAFLSGRHSIAGRSPLTGFWGEASVGGSFGAELRKCGYDGIVVIGKSSKPVYLWLDGEQAALKDASSLWGQDTFATSALIQKELGDKAVVSCIGPAGENLVRFAGVFTDGSHGRAAARCGLGALMGSKNLKAMAVKGSGKVPLADPEALKESVAAMRKDFQERLKGMSEFGTPGLVVPCETIGDLPINNWRMGKWNQGTAKISGMVLNEKYLKKQYFCAGCVVGCGRTVASVFDPELKETGGPEYETLALMGSNLLIDDMPAMLRLNEQVNRLGLDSIETGAALALAMELFEKGLIGPAELGDLKPVWGDAGAAEELIGLIARREGFGDLLADGLGATAEKVGGLAAEYAMAANNMALPGHDPRAYASLALSYATSSRGPCHLNGFSHIFERAVTFPEIGVDEVRDRFSWQDKADLVVGAQHIMHLWDSLALCKFGIFGGIRLEHISRWLKAVVDWDLSPQDLLTVGERIFTLKRQLNAGWGWSRKNDSLPARVLTRRNPDSGAGDHLPPFNLMLADYYRLRGWSEEGLPRPETMERLGLA